MPGMFASQSTSSLVEPRNGKDKSPLSSLIGSRSMRSTLSLDALRKPKESRAWLADQDLDPMPPLPASRSTSTTGEQMRKTVSSPGITRQRLISQHSLDDISNGSQSLDRVYNITARIHTNGTAMSYNSSRSRLDRITEQPTVDIADDPRLSSLAVQASSSSPQLNVSPDDSRLSPGPPRSASRTSDRQKTSSFRDLAKHAWSGSGGASSSRPGSVTPTPSGERKTSTPTPASHQSHQSHHQSHERRRIHNGTPAVLAKPTDPSPGSSTGDGNTVAQLYAVFGLPKDPSVWTLAEDDCVAGVHHIDGAVGRFWRPEVLGCSICPSPAELGIGAGGATTEAHSQRLNGDSREKDRKAPKETRKGSANPKFIEMVDANGRIEKVETARVLSKALKLSFTREVEIVSGQANYPPVAASHTFSFSVPTFVTTTQVSTRSLASESRRPRPQSTAGEGFGLSNPTNPIDAAYSGHNGSSSSSSNSGVGSGSGGGLPTSTTFFGVVLTVWSPSDEKRATAIKQELSRARARQSKIKKRGGLPSMEDTPDISSFLPASNAFFMPYAICIVSRYPLYNLLSDWNRWAWIKHSRNIEKHNRLMSIILSSPAPRLGDQLTIQSPDEEMAFSCTFPGALEWGSGLLGIDITMWPLFKALSVENILTICEIALAPNGRVLFMSRHPALLGLAVETIRYLVELGGWQGVTNQNCHARDVKIYLEDPGSWIIALSTELRSIIKPAKEVCVVDLDVNFVKCTHPPPGTPSTKGVREKRLKRLHGALEYNTGDFRPPREFTDAYPGGFFRPLSTMSSRGASLQYDPLDPPIWWDQPRVVAAFDKIFNDGKRAPLLLKLVRMRAGKNATTSEAEMAAILALRKRASSFVDARDGLENKIGRLNKRLAFLMSESDMWKAQFSKIQQLVDRLTTEANDTRAKLEKERRESRRLSSTLAQRDSERLQLQIQLAEKENLREEARNELLHLQSTMDALEEEREAMMSEIREIISGAGQTTAEDATFDTANGAGMYADSALGHGSSMSHRSDVSMTPSQTAEHISRARKAAEAKINQNQNQNQDQNQGREGSSTGAFAGSISGPGASAARVATTMSDISSAQGHHSNSSAFRNGSNVAANGSHRIGTAAASSLSHDAYGAPASSINHVTTAVDDDEARNLDITTRASTVTDQIARIQAQLESTLSHLEERKARGRHGGTSRSGHSHSHNYDHSQGHASTSHSSQGRYYRSDRDRDRDRDRDVPRRRRAESSEMGHSEISHNNSHVHDSHSQSHAVATGGTTPRERGGYEVRAPSSLAHVAYSAHGPEDVSDRESRMSHRRAEKERSRRDKYATEQRKVEHPAAAPATAEARGSAGKKSSAETSPRQDVDVEVRSRE